VRKDKEEEKNENMVTCKEKAGIIYFNFGM